jgi:pimeloyl-ACP methyl ester carboxylesterase
MTRETALAPLALLIYLISAPAPALELTPCRLDGAAGQPRISASCGRLSVPENPAAPQGRTIELFVARVAARSLNPQPDPFTILAGGPGQSAIDLYTTLAPAFGAIRRERDIVLVDQRGTGRSHPLDCPTEPGLDLETTERSVLLELVDQCLTTLADDPRFFTTSVAVRDLDQVRAALGITRWNLYGISYGTRVAQHYLRRYPARTRSVILDGVVPPELALGPDIAIHAQAALVQMFNRCQASAACRARFGDLSSKFAALEERLERAPVAVTLPDPLSGEKARTEFSHLELKGAIRLLSYTTDSVALLPLLIDSAYQGDYAPLAAQARMALTDLTEALNYGMHNAVVCTEDVPFFGPPDATALARTYLGALQLDALKTVCERWPKGALDPDFKIPVVSDTPVLILSGAADPITPAAYGDQVQNAGLSNAIHLVVPGQGHGMAPVGCTPQLMASFLERAAPGDLDADCLAQESPAPFFLNFSGPAP